MGVVAKNQRPELNTDSGGVGGSDSGGGGGQIKMGEGRSMEMEEQHIL